MFLRILLCAALLGLTACAGPLTSPKMTRSAAGGIAALTEIEQAAMIGAYTSPRSFDLVAPTYVEALNAFRGAMPPASDEAARSEERTGLRTAMGNCIEAVELQVEIHRTSGLSNDPSDFGARLVCESAAAALGRS